MTFSLKHCFNSEESIRRLSRTSSNVSFSCRILRNNCLSSSAIFSLLSNILKRDASALIILRSAPQASSKSNPSTPFSEIKITGYFPIYLSHSAVSLEIIKPSNSVLSAPISKKFFSILMFSVFPKRQGRVNRLTSPQLFNKSRMRPVLSI